MSTLVVDFPVMSQFIEAPIEKKHQQQKNRSWRDWALSIVLHLSILLFSLNLYMQSQSVNELPPAVMIELGAYLQEMSINEPLPIGPKQVMATPLPTQNSLESQDDAVKPIEKVIEQPVTEKIVKAVEQPVKELKEKGLIKKVAEVKKPEVVKLVEKTKIEKKPKPVSKVKPSATKKSVSKEIVDTPVLADKLAPISSAPVGDSHKNSAEFNSAMSKNSTARKSWQGQVFNHIAKHKRYPREALRYRLIGVSKLVFSVNHEGKVVAVELVNSAGSKILDKEALALIKRIQPFPIPPAELLENGVIKMTAPIAYDLRT